MGFIGQGFHPCTPPRTFLKKGSWNSQNFKKGIFINIFLKVLKIPKGLFQKSLWRDPGAELLADKLQFAPSRCFAQLGCSHKISFVQPIQNFTKTIDKNSEMV